MIQRFNTHLSMLPVFLHAQRRIWLSIPGDHRRVVYLEYESSLDHRLILAFDKVSDRIEILFVGLIIVVPKEVGYSTGTQYREEKIF